LQLGHNSDASLSSPGGGKAKFCVNCGNMATQEAYSEDMAYPQREIL